MAEVSLTLKGGRDYDAPWLTVKGESFSDIATAFADTAKPEVYGMLESALHALIEGNQLADVKVTLGATEEAPAEEEKPAHDTLPSENLLKTAATKSGRPIDELRGLSKQEVTDLITGKGK
jgi:hypothetical protein